LLIQGADEKLVRGINVELRVIGHGSDSLQVPDTDALKFPPSIDISNGVSRDNGNLRPWLVIQVRSAPGIHRAVNFRKTEHGEGTKGQDYVRGEGGKLRMKGLDMWDYVWIDIGPVDRVEESVPLSLGLVLGEEGIGAVSLRPVLKHGGNVALAADDASLVKESGKGIACVSG
jgi:hypothetical protein